jgi:hypothetical protein
MIGDLFTWILCVLGALYVISTLLLIALGCAVRCWQERRLRPPAVVLAWRYRQRLRRRWIRDRRLDEQWARYQRRFEAEFAYEQEYDQEGGEQ